MKGELPHSGLTLQKLSVKKTIDEYWKFLKECEDRGLEELEKLVHAGMAEFEEKKQQEEAKYEAASKAWGQYSVMSSYVAFSVRRWLII